MKKFLLFIVLFIFVFIFACVPKVSAYQSPFVNNRFYTSFKYDSVEIIGSDGLRFVSDSDNYFTKNSNEYENDNRLFSTTFENITLYKNYNFTATDLDIEYSYFTYNSEVQDITRLFIHSGYVLFDINDTFILYSDASLNNYQISFKIKLPDNEFKNVNEYINNIEYFNLTEYIVNNHPEVLSDNRNIIYLADVNINIRPQTYGSVHLKQTIHSITNYSDLITQWLDEYVPRPIVYEDVNVSNWILQIFNTFDRFLSIQFGDVSLGAILLIPLILSVVFVVLRIWRGGSA